MASSVRRSCLGSFSFSLIGEGMHVAYVRSPHHQNQRRTVIKCAPNGVGRDRVYSVRVFPRYTRYYFSYKSLVLSEDIALQLDDSKGQPFRVTVVNRLALSLPWRSPYLLRCPSLSRYGWKPSSTVRPSCQIRPCGSDPVLIVHIVFC